MLHFDPPAFARHGLATAVICCLIALVLTLSQRGAWDVQLVYSLAIGMTSWLAIELGLRGLRGTGNSPWPAGWRGIALVVCGMGTGFVLGSAIGDAYSGNPQSLLQRRDAVSTLLITVVASTAISFFFYSRGKASHLQARMAQAQRDAAEARLKLLEVQLEPHMLFNTLANLRALIAIDPLRAQDMLDRMVAYLRATLSASRASNHALTLEFDRLRDYLELMAVRMGPRLHFALDLPADLANQSVPTLLLQPLVENSIKHGLEPKVEGGTITVRARLAGKNMLCLEVSDTGVGFDSTAAASSGFGLAQVQERIAAAYEDKGSVEQKTAPGQGATTLLYLPMTTLQTV